MIGDDNDVSTLLATLAVKVAHLEAEVSKLETKYVQMERYINVERAVLGIVALVMSGLVAYALSHLMGAK